MTSGNSSYKLVPVSLAEANAFVLKHHRHHKPVVGSKFQVAVATAGEIIGVAIAGRPVARGLDDGWTIEVNRSCTDGLWPNVNSMLYGAVARAAFALGYRKVITYTLASESGISLRAAGWHVVAEIRGREWTTPTRPRVEIGGAQMEAKLRWEKVTFHPTLAELEEAMP